MRIALLCGVIIFCPLVWADLSEEPERVQVTETRANYLNTLRTLTPLQQAIDDTSFSSDSLALLFQQAPSVTLNGQGGLFQTINIRGFSRWRIQTRLEGVPIHTDRRAGTAMEFMPPAFVSQATVVTGAASTQWGSGALGGGVDVDLLIPEQSLMTFRYGAQQDYRDLFFGGSTHDGDISWLVNHRHANNSADSNGNRLLDGFEQHSIALRKRSSEGALRDALVFFSRANNVEKASADDPQSRVTDYPVNQHWLGKLSFDWHNATMYVHHATTQTQIERPNIRMNVLQNDALSLGFQFDDVVHYHHWQIHWRTGIDARVGVMATEREVLADNTRVFDQVNLNADQWESFASIELSRVFNNGLLVAGSRLTHMTQHDTLSRQSTEDTNTSGFVGYRFRLNPHWQLTTYVSNAYRIPSLTERFFTGSTPRGRVEGAVNLTPEKALNIDTHMQFEDEASQLIVGVFHQSLDNYIERLVINDELRQYRNLDWAHIRGLNYSGEHRFRAFDNDWRIQLGGQWLSGEGPNNTRIADISPAQHRVSVSALGEGYRWFIAITHRQRSDDVIDDEQATGSVNVVDAGYEYRINNHVQLALHLTNLTNQSFVTSRDILAPFARGRDIHFSVKYRPHDV